MVRRPYPDLSFVQVHRGFNTDVLGASSVVNLILTPGGYDIWALNSVIEPLNVFPQLPDRDGHRG